jgi:hypothetical protein
LPSAMGQDLRVDASFPPPAAVVISASDHPRWARALQRDYR